MRTTIDIDDDVLQAAKELAKAEKRTAGQVISALARKALSASSGLAAGGSLVKKHGWFVLPSRGGLVTNEIIAEIEERLVLEDAGLAGRELPARSDG